MASHELPERCRGGSAYKKFFQSQKSSRDSSKSSGMATTYKKHSQSDDQCAENGANCYPVDRRRIAVIPAVEESVAILTD